MVHFPRWDGWGPWSDQHDAGSRLTARSPILPECKECIPNLSKGRGKPPPHTVARLETCWIGEACTFQEWLTMTTGNLPQLEMARQIALDQSTSSTSRGGREIPAMALRGPGQRYEACFPRCPLPRDCGHQTPCFFTSGSKNLGPVAAMGPSLAR